MQYTIEQIRSVRNNYLEPPYPGFSLEEVCRRRRMTQTKLVRGANAWVAKGTAQTTEEWVSRLVQGSLNKLSERNFDRMVKKLETKELFATNEVLKSVVTMIFKKALDEPENSRLYAGVCYNLSMYEVSLADKSKSKRPHSELRNDIIATAQVEFQHFRLDKEKVDPNLSDEERHFAHSNFMRRKRANMRFVGELYLKDVLSYTTMFSIIDVIMRKAVSGGFPDVENIELLAELFTTVGQSLDGQRKKDVDRYFHLLTGLNKRADNPYPHRIRFKIMDLLDLRKAGWGTKPKPVKAPPPSGSAKDRKPAVAKKVAEKGPAEGRSWRDMAVTKPPSTAGAGSKAAPAAAAAPTSAAAPSASPRVAEAPLVQFELRVRSLFQEWAADRTNDFIPQWMNEFDRCDRTFTNAEDLCEAVAMEVIKIACTTTRKDAQREAYSFLIVGLFLTDEEVFRGFAGALASAIEDGLLEDVPKFSERFMQMLRLTSTEEEVNADVYYDAANVLRMAYNRLSDVDEMTVSVLMGFWKKVPQPEPSAQEDGVILNFQVIYSLCDPDGARPGLEELLSDIIDSLHDMGIVEDITIHELLTFDGANDLCSKVVEEYKELQRRKQRALA